MGCIDVMKKSRSLFYPILMFVLAQLAWFIVVGLWIYWYVTSNLIFKQVGENLSPQLISEQSNILTLVGGLILMVSVSVAISLIFRHLTIQMRITQMYDHFIANVTHELKSPLSSIQLYLETLRTRKIPPAKQEEFLDIMTKDAMRLQNLINTILDISGLEQKKFVYNFQVVTAGSTFRQLMQESARQLKLKKTSLSISEEAECPCVIDRNAMRIVFDNLMDNAIKYSEALPEVVLNLSCTTKYVLIEFTDHGIGIARKDQKKIFHKFIRLYSCDIPNVKGTGLGLSWIREIVKAHGGRISVHSEGLGTGSTFRIELPIYQTTKKRYIDQLLRITKRRKEIQGSGNG
jgi:two-component system phosphate regulon sensor histidine kinase PhoR